MYWSSWRRKKVIFKYIIGTENTGNTHHGTYYVNGLIIFHKVWKCKKVQNLLFRNKRFVLDEMTLSKIFINFPKKILIIQILVVFMAFKYLAVRLPQLVLFSKLYSTLEDSEAIYFHQKSNTTNVNIKNLS